MITVDVVVETFGTAGFTPWPIVEPVVGGFLRLSGQMTDAQVGTAMAALALSNAHTAEDGGTAMDGMGLLRNLTETDCVIAPGGLRFHEADTGVVVIPGCCSGLESWREWLDVLDGDAPWLGHDPTPGIRHADGFVGLWPDAERTPDPSPGAMIEFPTTELPTLLAAAQRDLRGFLSLLTRWTDAHAPALAGQLSATLNEHLRINEPLHIPR